MSRVIIIGAGQAGGQAAAYLARKSYDGGVLLLGEEALPPYERPPLSKAVLKGERQPEDGVFVSSEDLASLGVDLRLGCEVSALDRAARRVILGSGEAISYDKLLLATGGRPRALPLPGSGLDGVFLLRHADDARGLRARLQPGAKLAVIGGGFIGLEVAASARQCGCAVTVIEATPRILGRALPPEAAEAMAHLHREQGVEILTDTALEAFVGAEALIGIRLANGRVVPADVAVVGIGITPETALAEAAGLDVDDGILTDEYGQSSDPRIFAAGDCARAYLPRYGAQLRLESFQNANLQAENAARSILGESGAYDPVPWLWSDHYDWTLQTAGFPSAGDRVVMREYDDGKRLFFALEGSQFKGVAGLGRGASIAKDLRVAQMMLEHGINPDPAVLADPSRPLKKLLKSS